MGEVEEVTNAPKHPKEVSAWNLFNNMVYDRKYPKITRTIAGSMILDDVLDPRTDPVGSITEEVIGKDAADQAAAIEERKRKLFLSTPRFFILIRSFK